MIEDVNCWNGFGKSNIFSHNLKEQLEMEAEEYESEKEKHSPVHRWGKYQQ